MFLSFVVYNWESSRIESKFESLEEATDIPLFSRFHALRWTLMDRMSLLETTTVETPLVAWMYQSSAFCMNSTEMIPIDHWKFWVQAAAMGNTGDTHHCCDGEVLEVYEKGDGVGGDVRGGGAVADH